MEVTVPIKLIPMGLNQGNEPWLLKVADLAPTHRQVDGLLGGLDQPAEPLSKRRNFIKMIMGEGVVFRDLERGI